MQILNPTLNDFEARQNAVYFICFPNFHFSYKELSKIKKAHAFCTGFFSLFNLKKRCLVALRAQPFFLWRKVECQGKKG